MESFNNPSLQLVVPGLLERNGIWCDFYLCVGWHDTCSSFIKRCGVDRLQNT